MKVLMVGGTGMIGVHTALLLGERGAEVTVMARNAPHPDSPVAGKAQILAPPGRLLCRSK